MFYPSGSVGRLVREVLAAVLYLGQKETDVFQKILQVNSARSLSIASKHLFSHVEIFRVYLAQNGLWNQSIKTVVLRSDVSSANSVK